MLANVWLQIRRGAAAQLDSGASQVLESHSAILSVHSDVFVLFCPTECDSIGISLEIHTNSRGNHALGLSPSCAISTTIRHESLKSYSFLVQLNSPVMSGRPKRPYLPRVPPIYRHSRQVPGT